MQNILAAIDFSDVTDAVVDQGATLARAFLANLWIIHVAAPDPEFIGYGVGPQHERDWRAMKLRDEHRYIQDKAKALEADGLTVTPILVQGFTVDTILKEAARLCPIFLVVGSHGHGKLYQMLVGTVAEGLLMSSRYPLVIVPSPR